MDNMENFTKALAQTLIKVGYLDGVVSMHQEDEVSIQGGHFDNYLVATYLGQLLERGEIEIKIKPERMDYLVRLLKLQKDVFEKNL